MSRDERFWKPGTETLSIKDFERHRYDRLLHQLKYAYDNCIYYRNCFNNAGIDLASFNTIEDYYSLPFTSKIDFIENQAKNPPFGDLLAINPVDVRHIYIAPGTICMPFTDEDFNSFSEIFARGFYACGARKEDVVNVTTTFHWVLAGEVMSNAFRKIGCAVIPGGAGMSKMHIEMMRWTRTTVVFGFATFLEYLGETARQMGLDPGKDLSLRLLIITGEIRTDSTKRGLEETFGAEVREIYATADLGVVAAECHEGGGMHLNEDYMLEIIDPDTQKHVPLGEGGDICKPVVLPINRGDMLEQIKKRVDHMIFREQLVSNLDGDKTFLNTKNF
jgi:phenylacetate-CoA ligase